MTALGLRTTRELRGRPCLELELVRPDRKTLVRSCSFGQRIEKKVDLRQVLAKRAERAAEKLREESLVARGISIFITTKRFGPLPHHPNGVAGRLPEHIARSAAFVKVTRCLLEPIYREGYGYKKAGVKLYDIQPARPHQESFFGRRRSKDESLMGAVDRVNAEYGSEAVRIAATGQP